MSRRPRAAVRSRKLGGFPAWLTTSTLQINSDDEEYEFGEDEEDDDGSEEDDLDSGDAAVAEGAADNVSGAGERDGDGDTFVFTGVTSRGPGDK